MDCSALLNASWVFCGAADEVVKGSRAVRETAWRAFCSPTGFAKPGETFSWFWNLPLDVFEGPWDGLFGTFERFASGLWGCMGDVLFLPGFRETRGSLVRIWGLPLDVFASPWDGLFGTLLQRLWACMGDVLPLPGFREPRGSLVLDLGLAFGCFFKPLGWIVQHF